LSSKRPRCLALALVVAAAASHSTIAVAQERQLTVVIEAIAGSNLYLNAGLEAGIEEHDTLAVRRSDGTVLGAFVVVTASAKRAVVTFAGRPFAITRGDVLDISWAGADIVQATSVTPSTARTRQLRRSRVPTASGRLSLEVSSLQSTTIGLGSTPTIVDRSFVTPASRFRFNVSDLPAGLRLQTSGRVMSQYASGAPETVRAAHIYQASVGGSYQAAQFQFGRFYSPYEEYSGFWDGVLLRFGPRQFGVGVTAGFEPLRSDETFSQDLRKVSVFANYQRGPYATDLSLHMVRHVILGETHTFLGWSQDVGLGAFRFGQRLQVDRDPITQQWTLSDLQFRSGLAIGRTAHLHAQYSRRSPFLTWNGPSTLSYRYEQIGGGVSFIGQVAQLHLNASANRFQDEDFGWSYSASAALTPPGSFGLGISGSARYWEQQGRRGLYLSPGLTRSFGRVRAQGFYHYYKTDHLTGATVTHSGDLSLNISVSARVQTSLRGYIQRSQNLNSLGLFTSLGMSF
jgi:hypothetical protein